MVLQRKRSQSRTGHMINTISLFQRGTVSYLNVCHAVSDFSVDYVQAARCITGLPSSAMQTEDGKPAGVQTRCCHCDEIYAQKKNNKTVQTLGSENVLLKERFK